MKFETIKSMFAGDIPKTYNTSLKCFGDLVAFFEYYKEDKHSITAVVDLFSYEVLQIDVIDFKNSEYYRWTDEKYVEDFESEMKEKDIDPYRFHDFVFFWKVYDEPDILQKAQGVYTETDYDEGVSIPLEVDDETLFILMKEAHEKDITFNQYIGEVILKACDHLSPPEETENDQNKEYDLTIDILSKWRDKLNNAIEQNLKSKYFIFDVDNNLKKDHVEEIERVIGLLNFLKEQPDKEGVK